jgi:hypothetical protein
MRHHRVVLLAALVALAPVLAGCENFDLDKLDFLHLSSKKPLPGKRELLFPNGVPGVAQGIPKEYTKGYQEQQAEEQQDAGVTPLPGQTTNPPAAAASESKTAAVAPTEKSKPKPKAKKTVKHKVKPKPKLKPSETAAASADQSQESKQKLEPWPKQTQSNTAAWPSESNTAAWPAQTQPSTAPWPSTPASGTSSQ